jgi:hypothetical protein
MNFPLCLLLTAAAMLFPFEARAVEGLAGSASSNGDAMMVVGANPYDLRSTQAARGSIDVRVVDAGNRWSQLQNVDGVNVNAEFTSGPDSYRVVVAKAMPRHPLGKYTTWFGVVYNAEMHGKTGIGTTTLPKVTPEIALWGWAKVWRNGQLISAMAPAHVMVMSHDPLKGIALDIATEDKSLLGSPDGYLHVMWPTVGSLTLPEAGQRQHEIAGWAALLAVAAGFWWLANREHVGARQTV